MNSKSEPFHDLKTDRQDIGKPLPKVLAVVPLLFCFSLVCAIALNLMFFFKIRESEGSQRGWQRKAETESIEQASTRMAIEGIKSEERRANDVRDWVEGSRQIQPLAVGIARSMGVKSSIEELSLFRDLENPNQIRIGLKFDNGGQKQLDSTLSAINALGYRSYSANQTSGQGGQVDYQATLIWQNSGSPKTNLSLNNEQ